MSPLGMKPGEEIQADSLIFTVLSAHHALSYFCALPPTVPLSWQCCNHLLSLPNTILFALQNQFSVLAYKHQKKDTRQKQVKILTYAG